MDDASSNNPPGLVALELILNIDSIGFLVIVLLNPTLVGLFSSVEFHFVCILIRFFFNTSLWISKRLLIFFKMNNLCLLFGIFIALTLVADGDAYGFKTKMGDGRRNKAKVVFGSVRKLCGAEVGHDDTDLEGSERDFNIENCLNSYQPKFLSLLRTRTCYTCFKVGFHLTMIMVFGKMIFNFFFITRTILNLFPNVSI